MHELDQTLLKCACDRIAGTFDDADFFCAETRERLLERLSLMSLEPDTIIELGAGTGAAALALRQRYPDALVVELDRSLAMLAQNSAHRSERICADSQQVPVTDQAADIVISNMMLPVCAIPEQVFSEARRLLRAPGLFLFNTLGPDTLKELRRAWAQVDDAEHVHAFADMHNIGDALVNAGFREPVMDVEILTVTYQNFHRLVMDLRAVAANNYLASRRRGLTTPRLWQRMLDAADTRRTPGGALTVTVEIVTGQAWTAEAGPGVGMEAGVARFPLSRLRS